MAFTNCPKVSVDARLPLTTSVTKGFSDVCISALPMPRSEKETSISPNELPNNGRMRDNTVTTSDSNTVFLRPMRFISMPVGTEKIRNQKKTSDGRMFATLSVRSRSALT